MVHHGLHPTSPRLVCHGAELFDGHYWYGLTSIEAIGLIPDLDLEWIDGGHHFHMEAGAPSVAQRIERFLQ